MERNTKSSADPDLRPALRGSLTLAQKAFAEGRDANDRGQWKNACPYPEHSGVDMLRAQWMKGWQHSEADRGPATS